jgi:FkbM family methyltransferase
MDIEMSNIRKWLKAKLPQNAYSQEGEDLILNRIFETKSKGFYIDVGAHHPFRFSNTYLFYRRGWHGINIDATPGSMEVFEKYRPRDISIEVAISSTRGQQPFYIFKEAALNTFDEKRAQDLTAYGHKVLRTVKVESFPLKEVLNLYEESNQLIDFLTVDVEGFDLQVLQSNDWDIYRPTIVLVESQDFDLESPSLDPIYSYLVDLEYRLEAKTVNTIFFADSKSTPY